MISLHKVNWMFNLKGFKGVDKARLILVATSVLVDSLTNSAILILTVEILPSWGIPVIGLLSAMVLKLQPIVKRCVTCGNMVRIWLGVEILWFIGLLFYPFNPLFTFICYCAADLIGITFMPVIYSMYAEDLAKRDANVVSDYNITRNVILADSLLVGTILSMIILYLYGVKEVLVVGVVFQLLTLVCLLKYRNVLNVDNNYQQL